MKPILVTAGEPAGIGLDICLALADSDLPVVILANKQLMAERAQLLGKKVILKDYDPTVDFKFSAGELIVLSIDYGAAVTAGTLNPENAKYVIQMLTMACQRTLDKEFAAIVTAPVHKAVLNDAGFSFTGHTEFFQNYCHSHEVVMLLAGPTLKVALVTTHLPLRKVADAITVAHLTQVIQILHQALIEDFGIPHPNIAIAGLNPHAGESGYLGREEIEVITPVITSLQQQGLRLSGPFPADTLFSPENCAHYDVFLTMYHDQGLPVLKYKDFSDAVNITLGLPLIRTSVDHGTALELAGTGRADPSSLIQAVKLAHQMAQHQQDKETQG